jgi:hypothetical protein
VRAAVALGALLLATLLIAATQLPSALNPRKIPLFTVTAFSLLILLKMILHTRFHQYGFILAIMPTMLLAIALLDLIPAYLARKNLNPWTFRLPALAVLAMLAVVSVTISKWNLAEQKYAVGSGPDTFYTDNRAPILSDAINFLQQNTKPADTLTVLPEGLMLNVLADRQTSIPYLSALPSDITMFSEEKILAALQENPPAFIAITHRPSSDFGQKSFGTDYALTLRNFITQHYHPVHLAGDIPYTTGQFGILILERNR